MCGRFANHVTELREWADILADWPAGASVGYNIAPTQMIPVFTSDGGQAMRWGLIPNWAKEIPKKFATYNARLDTIAGKPTYRHAWSHGQRCLVPILGYYEWRKEGASRQPYFIRSVSGSPLVMAGLWEPGRGDLPASCTVLTTEAVADIAHIHPRMPVMIARDFVDEWFSTLPGDLPEVLAQRPETPFTVYRVGSAVNNSRAGGEELIQAIVDS